MRFITILPVLILLGLGIAACSGDDATPTPTARIATAQPTTILPTATQFVANPGGVRRAPTLAPTNAPTEIPTQVPTTAPSETPLPTSTATDVPAATQAAAATSLPVATATPNVAPGVYVTAFRIDPPEPKTKPAEFFFTVNFLNTVGEPVNYPLWRVLLLPKGQTKAVGDPQGTSKTIAVGASEQATEPWSIRIAAGCEPYVAQPVWQDEEGRQIPLNKPDGSSAALEFQVCP